MKKIYFIISAIILMLALYSCSENAKKISSSAEGSTQLPPANTNDNSQPVIPDVPSITPVPPENTIPPQPPVDPNPPVEPPTPPQEEYIEYRLANADDRVIRVKKSDTSFSSVQEELNKLWGQYYTKKGLTDLCNAPWNYSIHPTSWHVHWNGFEGKRVKYFVKATIARLGWEHSGRYGQYALAAIYQVVHPDKASAPYGEYEIWVPDTGVVFWYKCKKVTGQFPVMQRYRYSGSIFDWNMDAVEYTFRNADSLYLYNTGRYKAKDKYYDLKNSKIVPPSNGK